MEKSGGKTLDDEDDAPQRFFSNTENDDRVVGSSPNQMEPVHKQPWYHINFGGDCHALSNSC